LGEKCLLCEVNATLFGKEGKRFATVASSATRPVSF